MSSGMNAAKAKELASRMNYKWAVGNLQYGFKGVAYKKATTILLHELAEIADRLVLCKDCIFWSNNLCKARRSINVTYADDFCSFGMRRKDRQ